jgi:predicted metalloprotease
MRQRPARQARTTRATRWVRRIAVAAVLVLPLSACGSLVDGTGRPENAPNVNLSVAGVDAGSSFDTTAQNALSDIETFWKKNYPKVSGGKSLPPLKGGLYSVDGLSVAQTGQLPDYVAHNECAKQSKSFVIDNGAYCVPDDSIAWDRAPTHLFAQLADHYGPLMVALIFAHEFGHAISARLGIFNENLPTIDTESQADCAAGAWAASALHHQDAHFLNTTPQRLDDALEGFLDGRDSTPGTIDEISHGNGFDRLSALADGLKNGVTYCYSKNYFDRTFTERPFTDQKDYDAGGNEPLGTVIDTSADNPLVVDLNRFWTAQAKTINKTFTPVKIAEAAHPKCGASTPASQFGYCPDDNTVYFSAAFARQAYYSLPDTDVSSGTANVRLVFHQPADFALGELFSVAWGLAVRHQLFSGAMGGQDALLASVCYSGAYAKNINVVTPPSGGDFTLSPSDLDEAVSSLLDEAGTAKAFGSRESTGLDRIQSFVQGYKQSLSSC